MSSTQTDRLDGLTTSVAVKAPCKAYTTASITQTGEQTIGGVACVDGDRYVYNLSPANVLNGIWVDRATAHERAKDFDGARDVVKGTLVLITAGNGDGAFYKVTTANPIVIGATAIGFAISTAFGELAAQLVSTADVGLGDALIGVKSPITGGTARTQHQKNQDFVTPEDFGSVGDGVTDDTAAIQAAFTGSPHTRLTDGKTYLVSTVSLPSNRRVSGRGTLKLKTNTNNWIITNTDAGAGNTNIVIEGITLDGNKANQSGTSLLYGVYFSRVTDSRIQGLKINDCKEDGILLGSSGAGQMCERVKVLDNTCTNNSRNGISIVAGDRCEVKRNTVVGCAGTSTTENAGIDIEADNSTVSVSHNDICDNLVMNVGSAARAGRGITCVNAVGGTMTDNNVSRNRVYNCGSHGIELQDLTYVTANENEVVGCGLDTAQTTHGIYCNNSDDATLNNNRVRAQGSLTALSGSGIFINLSDRATINGNKCRSNYGAGIDIRGSRHGTATGNLCVNNGVGGTTGSGIHLQTVSATVPSGWVIIASRCYDTAGGAGTQAYGIELVNADSNTIHHNDLTGNRTAGMLEAGTTNKISRNTGHDPLGYWSAAPAVPATTVNATNTSNHPCTVYIESGTNVIPSVGGDQITSGVVAPTPSVDVEPGQTISLAYTAGTPTWRWFRK